MLQLNSFESLLPTEVVEKFMKTYLDRNTSDSLFVLFERNSSMIFLNATKLSDGVYF